MIITTAKLLHSTILKILLTLTLIFIVLFSLLLSGVTIPKVSLPGLEMNQFYIKLDKKLIISVDSIVVHKRNRPAKTVKELDNIATAVEYLPKYFREVTIKKLTIGDRIFHLLYSGDIFYFESDRFSLASQIRFDPKTKTLEARVAKLLIKDPNAELSGLIRYDLHKEEWSGSGLYDAFGIEGSFRINHKKEYFSFELDSKPCSSIKPLIDYIDPPEEIKVWIYPKIPAKRYILHYLRGGFYLKKGGTIEFDPTKLMGFATAYDAKIHFHPNVPPVAAAQIDVRLRNDTLSFRLHKPRYEGKRLDGSYVKIRNLTNRMAELDAHIVAKGKIDKSVKAVLNAYGIALPFVQTEGVTDAVVDFTVGLASGKIVKYSGQYRSKYAKLLFDNVVPLPVKGLNVISKESKIEILPCRITYEPYLDANLSGSIDLKAKKGIFAPLLERAAFEYRGLNLIDMRSLKQTEVLLDFNKDIRFSMPELKIDLKYRRGGGVEADADNLKLLKPFFRGPLSGVEGGRLHVDYNDSRIHADADLKYPNDIFEVAGNPLENFEITVDGSQSQTHIRINDRLFITAQQERTFFNIKDVDIDVDNLLQNVLTYRKSMKNASGKESLAPHLLYIEGHRSRLSYKRLELPCDFYNVKVYTDPLSIKFETKHRDGEIRGIVEDGKLNVAGKNLSDTIMKGLTTLDQLEGGSFDFDAKGVMDDFNGTILMRDTLWAKTAFYNNLLATLNTIPAILTLKNPGFSKNGFKIKRGALDYRFKDGTLFFKKIVIEGYSAQITGKGTIDLKKDMIALKLQIHFLESLTNVLNKIPVAGYLIFGKDGTLAVTLNVKGDLNDPKVSTEATKDLIKAPLNILERTLTLPFKIFE